MAKKDLNQDLYQQTVVEEPQEAVLAEPYYDMVEDDFYEADAYDIPQTENGQDVTFVKPVGIGAPVPIVAPKHTNVQLQPIVVPLAVIPYMSQDTDVLYANRREQQPQRRQAPQRQGQPVAAHNDASYPTEFSVEDHAKAKKSCKVRARVCSFFTLLLSALVLALFGIGAYTFIAFGGGGFAINNTKILFVPCLESVGVFVDFIMKGQAAAILQDPSTIVGVVICAVALVQAIVALITLIGGRYPRVWNCLASLVVFGGLLGLMIKDIIVIDTWVVDEWYMEIVAVGLAFIGFLLAVIFSISLNRLDNKVERMEMEF